MRRSRNRGFSLIELLVVVTIIVILGSMLVVGLNKAIKKAGFVNCQSNMKQLGSMIQQYTLRCNSLYPKFSNYTWIGQLDYLAGGTYGWKRLAEYPQYANNPAAQSDLGSYFIVFTREDKLFECPTGKRQRVNLQGVRSSYNGLSIRDYVSVDSISEPEKAILLLEYDANEARIVTGNDPNATIFIDDSIAPPTGVGNQPVELFRVSQNHGDCGNILFCDQHIECATGQALMLLSWEDDFSTSTTSTTTSSTVASSSVASTVGSGSSGGSSSGSSSGSTSSGSGSSSTGGGGTSTSSSTGGGGPPPSSSGSGSGSTSGGPPPSSTSSSSSSVSTTTSTTSTTAKVYIGPPF